MTKLIVTLTRQGRRLKYYMEVDPRLQLFLFVPAFSNKDEPRFTIRVVEGKLLPEGTDDPALQEEGKKEVAEFLRSGLSRTFPQPD